MSLSQPILAYANLTRASFSMHSMDLMYYQKKLQWLAIRSMQISSEQNNSTFLLSGNRKCACEPRFKQHSLLRVPQAKISMTTIYSHMHVSTITKVRLNSTRSHQT